MKKAKPDPILHEELYIAFLMSQITHFKKDVVINKDKIADLQYKLSKARLKLKVLKM